jgi:hypothetical protein
MLIEGFVQRTLVEHLRTKERWMIGTPHSSIVHMSLVYITKDSIYWLRMMHGRPLLNSNT